MILVLELVNDLYQLTKLWNWIRHRMGASK